MRERAETFQDKGWNSFSDPECHRLALSMLEKIKTEEATDHDTFDASGAYQKGDIYQTFPEVRAFFDGPAGDFLRAAFDSDFKIFFGKCYKSVHNPDGPAGSQQWHADGGPGTCVKLMWCLSSVTEENGAMECLDWSDSLRIFEQERTTGTGIKASVTTKNSIEKRQVKTDFFNEAIAKSQISINQPTADEGMVLAFLNNTIHRGGFPEEGHERYVCIFAVYPSAVPTPFSSYMENGIAKGINYPADPAFGDGN